MKSFIVINSFVVLLLVLTIVKSSTGIQSSICPTCGEHYLLCPNGQQIDISSAYQGFTLNNNTCTDCKEECCKYYKNDCLEHYRGLEYGPLMRCCGKTRCTLKGSVGNLSYCKQYETLAYKDISSYSEITYRCIDEPTIKPSTASDWKEMSSLQVVIDGTKPYYCTYYILSFFYNFFQTNTKSSNYRLHNLDLKSNVHYSIIGRSKFTTPPYTDVYIILSGYSRTHTIDSGQVVTVQYRCSNESTDSSIESTTMVSAQTTAKFMVNKVTEGQDDFLEGETNLQTREEYEDSLQLKGQEKNENILVGSILGGIAGLCLLLLIFGFIIFIFKKRHKESNQDEGFNGCENPGYEISNPDNISTVESPREINIKNDNSSVEYLRDDIRFDTLPDVRYTDYNIVPVLSGFNRSHLHLSQLEQIACFQPPFLFNKTLRTTRLKSSIYIY